MFGPGDFSLVARTFWHTFGLNLKGFFTHFVVVSSYLVANFSYFIVVFSRLFAYKKHFFRTLCFFKIFKRFVFGLFALVIASCFCENGEFSIIFTFWIATLALLARNDGQRKYTLSFGKDGGFCHFERSEKSTQIKRKLAIFGYFACAQYNS